MERIGAHDRPRTTRAQREHAAATQPKGQQPQADPVQADWTQKIVDPQVQARARAQHDERLDHPDAARIRSLNEAAEHEVLGGKNKPGVLVDLGGDPRKGTTLTVHGINDNPASTMALGDKAEARGASHQAFAYDDRSRRLGASADDLGREIKRVLAENPKAPLTIHAHSMGGRVATVALARLEQEGALAGKNVSLNLVAPPLQGYGSANGARFGGQMIPALRSSLDMGTTSKFQRELEAARLPHVKVSVLAGTADDTIGMDKPKSREAWTRIARGLAGKEPTLVEGADHMSILKDAARRLP
jgi:hypothetical protein